MCGVAVVIVMRGARLGVAPRRETFDRRATFDRATSNQTSCGPRSWAAAAALGSGALPVESCHLVPRTTRVAQGSKEVDQESPRDLQQQQQQQQVPSDLRQGPKEHHRSNRGLSAASRAHACYDASALAPVSLTGVAHLAAGRRLARAHSSTPVC